MQQQKHIIHMLTDIEIAKSVKLRPINDIAAELGINENLVENYGRYIAKISTNIIDKKKFKKRRVIYQSSSRHVGYRSSTNGFIV